MKAFYDKLILIVGLLLLAGGVYLYLGSKDVDDQVSSLSVPNNPYEALETLTVEGTDAREWNRPSAQPRDTNAVFDLFTPPKIYYNPTQGVFTFDAGEDPPPAPRPFGVELVKMERELYRIQLEGFLQGPAGDEDNHFILLRNARTGEGIRAREGDVLEAENFTVKSFSVERRLVTPDDPNVTPYVVEDVDLVIEDREIGRDINLTVNNLRYNDAYDITIAATDGSGRTWDIEKEGDSFTHEGESFKVTKISLENNSVTVEKTGPELEEPVINELPLRSQGNSPTNSRRASESTGRASQGSTPENEATNLDDIFPSN